MYFYGGLALAVVVAVAMALKVRGAKEPSARAKLVAGLNSFWGVVTVLFFAPAGGLAALISFDQRSGFAGMTIGAVSLDGVALGIALFVASRRLLKQKKVRTVKAIAYWSLAHHVAVVLAFLPMDVEVAGACLVPCSIGAALAIGLIRRANALGSVGVDPVSF